MLLLCPSAILTVNGNFLILRNYIEFDCGETTQEQQPPAADLEPVFVMSNFVDP